MTRGRKKAKIKLNLKGRTPAERRREFSKMLKPHPKVLLLLGALGADVPQAMLEKARNDVLANERRWRQR